jgi:hypothetical protein
VVVVKNSFIFNFDLSRFLRHIAFFFLIFLAIAYVKRLIIPYSYGNDMFREKLDHYLNHCGEYNVVAFGSSRIYRQFNPVVFDSLTEKAGLSSFNFGVSGTYNPEAYFLFQKFIAQSDLCTPQLAFLEIQVLRDYETNNISTTRGSYWNSISVLNYTIGYIINSEYSSKKKLRMITSYIRSHLIGLVDLKILMNSAVDSRYLGERGFYSLELNAREFEGAKGLIERREEFNLDTTALADRFDKTLSIELGTEDVNYSHLKYLNQLKRNAEARGIRVIFILPPRLSEENLKELLPILTELPEKDYIDLCSQSRLKYFYLSENSFDLAHLNEKGAALFSRDLADELMKGFGRQ